MIDQKSLRLDVGEESVSGDSIRVNGSACCLLLHGAGAGDRRRWLPLRLGLAGFGVGSVAIDFSGHGQSTGRTAGSLTKRMMEARAALHYLEANAPRVVIGISMSGEIAVRLAAEQLSAGDHLVTIAGAAYDAAAFEVPFGPGFTDILRRRNSWTNSHAFVAIRSFRGTVTVIRAANDEVVPRAIGQRMADSCAQAARVDLIDIPDVTHAIGSTLQSDEALTARLAHYIARTLHTSGLTKSHAGVPG